MISFPYGRRYISVSDKTKQEVVDILLIITDYKKY